MYYKIQKLFNFSDLSDIVEVVALIRISPHLYHLEPMSIIFINVSYEGACLIHSLMNLFPEIMFLYLGSSSLWLWDKNYLSLVFSFSTCHLLILRNLVGLCDYAYLTHSPFVSFIFCFYFSRLTANLPFIVSHTTFFEKWGYEQF